MQSVVFYDNKNGFTAFLAANMLTGHLDVHHMPSFKCLEEKIQSFRPSDGTVHSTGYTMEQDIQVAYMGCREQSHIIVKCCRNFISLYRLKQPDYAFIYVPSFTNVHKGSDCLTPALYKSITKAFPHIQAAVWSVICSEMAFLRRRPNTDHTAYTAIGGSVPGNRHTLSGTHVIYHCFGSAHSSITSAAIHLHRLPWDRRPSIREITSLPDYDRSETWQIGTLNFKGHDESGAAIYTIGLGPQPQTVKRALFSFLNLIGCDLDGLIMNEALVHINRVARIGGALSRRYGYVRLGRYVSAYGIQIHYDRLVNFVKKVNHSIYR
jgi:hypothetical protein